MDKTILQYQKAYASIVQRLKENEQVLAVMVFGSMVTGDLWEESDIDLFVIVNYKLDEITNVYTNEKKVSVHIKLMSKEKFIKFYSEGKRGGFLHRIFSSSRLVFSKDSDVTARYDRGRYYPDIEREKWNVFYLGNVIKNIGVCKKYLSNDGLYTAYCSVVKCIEDYAKLYINMSGYMISKDATTMAMNLNDSFRDCVESLFFTKNDPEKSIKETIAYIQDSIDVNIADITKILLDYMREENCFLSSEEIKAAEVFKSYDIAMEDVLQRLAYKNVVKKETRNYKSENGKLLFNENVYYL